MTARPLSTGFVWHERYMWHDTGSASGTQLAGGLVEPGQHAESPASKRRLKNLMDVVGLTARLVPIEPRPATLEQVLRVHERSYLERLAELSSRGGGMAGHNAPVGAGSYEIALLSAGGVLAAVDAVFDERVENAYALVRPPGHHALADAGLGFCLLGNAAIAARYAQDAWRAERIAVVDFDVHHGNGTQAAFYADPSVLTVSVHQEDWFPPRSGDPREIGEGPGTGLNVNVALPAGSGREAYVQAFERIVVPALEAYAPELVLVAAGYDASAMDPLGRMLLAAADFGVLMERLKAVAERVSAGRMVVLHEGGYSEAYVPFCGLATVEALAGVTPRTGDPYAQRFASETYHRLRSDQEHAIERAEPALAALRAARITAAEPAAPK